MLRWFTMGAALLLLPLFVAAGEETVPAPKSEWVLATLKDSLEVTNGDTLTLHHSQGDVRLETAAADRVQVTAVAQHHAADPRLPAIRFTPAKDPARDHRLVVDFAALEIAEREEWAKRRIDIGLLVPEGIAVEIETTDGLIEAKNVQSRATLTSTRGEITYKGTGDLVAHTERGAIRAILKRTRAEHQVIMTSLTGDLWCTFLEGANAQVDLMTRGPITTDYSIEIDRNAGSPLKKGQVRMGSEGSAVRLESHSGAIRLQGLIVPEDS